MTTSAESPFAAPEPAVAVVAVALAASVADTGMGDDKGTAAESHAAVACQRVAAVA